jgi:hypothetical protein
MESKQETLQRVKDEYANNIDYKNWSDLAKVHISTYAVDDIAEAYRIERNKQEAPDESKLKTIVEQFKSDNLWDEEILDAYKTGIQWAINHFTNISK